MKKAKEFDIHTNQEWIEEYGFNAENRPIIKVNPNEVPKKFIRLIPYVEKWGIPCDLKRGDFFDKQPQKDIDEFAKVIQEFEEEINEWLDVELNQEFDNVIEAAWQFMYMMKAYSET
ncbi:MAG: hypothetical protein HWE27_06845 [Gammaproteobacteria bacterium]|nr:hypothetical protein [Gammaproteobacteria bacterium]